MPTIKMPSQSDVDKRYKDAIGKVPARYQEGVDKTTDWKEKAVAGQDLYEQKMSDPEVLSRREKALGDVSNEEWKNKAKKLGGARIGAGMTENADKRTKNYEPFRAALDGVELAPKTADPMQNIDNNVKAVVKKLVETKKAVMG